MSRVIIHDPSLVARDDSCMAVSLAIVFRTPSPCGGPYVLDRMMTRTARDSKFYSYHVRST